jgi:hypothetical protein
LKDFVEEMVSLTIHGIQFMDLRMPVTLVGLICDAPARSFITGIKGHSGYFGCGKCVQEGDHIKGRVCFPDIAAPLRSDLSFLEKTQPKHHTATSDLERIPGFGMVSQVPYEYMHLTCLGVMRKLILQWMRSKDLAVRLRSTKIDAMSEKLEALRKHTCSEFAR